jgi:hypothetical protein
MRASSQWWLDPVESKAVKTYMRTQTYHQALLTVDTLTESFQLPHVKNHYAWPDPSVFHSAILFHKLHFCPVCGDVWLRCFITPEPTYSKGQITWGAVASPCSKHGGGVVSFLYPLPLFLSSAVMRSF